MEICSGDIAQNTPNSVSNIGGHDGMLTKISSGVVSCHGMDEDASGGKEARGGLPISGFGIQAADQSRQAVAGSSCRHTAVAMRLDITQLAV